MLSHDTEGTVFASGATVVSKTGDSASAGGAVGSGVPSKNSRFRGRFSSSASTGSDNSADNNTFVNHNNRSSDGPNGSHRPPRGFRKSGSDNRRSAGGGSGRDSRPGSRQSVSSNSSNSQNRKGSTETLLTETRDNSNSKSNRTFFPSSLRMSRK